MDKIRFIEFDFAYEHRGSGTPLVLIHGFPLDGGVWNEVVPLLEDKFEILIPDLRGFGMSTTGNVPPSMDIYARDIADMLDYFRLEKAAIVGHSMGGYIALAFARLYPNRVSGLGLVSSQALADTPERKQGRYDTAAQVAEKGVSVVVEAMTSKFTSDLELQEIAREIMQSQKPQGVMDALKAIAERMDASASLSDFKFPVVIVHGDADMLIPLDRARDMKNSIPHAHLIELKGVGHLPMLESPQETAKALIKLA